MLCGAICVRAVIGRMEDCKRRETYLEKKGNGLSIENGPRLRWAEMTEEQREEEVYRYRARLSRILGLARPDRAQHRRRYLKRHRHDLHAASEKVRKAVERS